MSPQVRLGLGIRTRQIRRRAQRVGLEPSAAVLEVRALTELLGLPAPPLDRERQRQRPGDSLDVAFIVQPYFPGSGGHMTISNIIRGLESRGHRVSIWIDDTGKRDRHIDSVERRARQHFGPFQASFHIGFEDWAGADVVVATAWQTVARARTLGGVGARAYFIQDHEIEFFSTSFEKALALDSYKHGFHPITAGTWLAQVMREEYGEKATPFELGTDTDLYRPVPGVERRQNVVAFYARQWTPRRAVPVALAAVAELKRRRPETELWGFGEDAVPRIDVPVKNVGVLPASELPSLYSEATVGLVLSMTNYSLVAQEMLACELPCVELASPSSQMAFGGSGAVELAPLEPHAIADALQMLLDEPEIRAQRVRAGRDLIADRTWAHAAAGVEAGLFEALSRGTGG